MNEQEKQIVRLLLNEMAIEGAIRHFHEPPPTIPMELYAELQQIGVPGRYNGSRETYAAGSEARIGASHWTGEKCSRDPRIEFIVEHAVMHKILRTPEEQRVAKDKWKQTLLGR